ncbi:MAG: M48 family metalloprotease [Candidatus Kerfeldbacteria bacterium]
MTVYQQIASNKRRTVFLMVLFFVLVFAVGFFVGEYWGPGGYSGLFFAGIFSIVMGLVSFFGGDKLSLATAGAKELTNKDQFPYVWRMVENLTITAGLPMPKVYIIDDPAMNAFATGRDPEKASIALTTGLIGGLENEELEGVIAHELSHVKNYDTRLMMIVVVLVGVLTLLADWMFRATIFGGGRRGGRKGGGAQIELIFAIVGVALIILSPIIAEVIKLAISRKREFLADASAVLLTRYADGLAGALKKISGQDMQLRRANHATAHLFIANPFKSTKMFSKMFSTHPPVEERIAKLQQMGGNPEFNV